MERGCEGGGRIPLDGRSVCGGVSVGVCLWGKVVCVCVGGWGGQGQVNAAWHGESS